MGESVSIHRICNGLQIQWNLMRCVSWIVDSYIFFNQEISFTEWHRITILFVHLNQNTFSLYFSEENMWMLT